MKRPITPRGYERLKQELQRLRSLRPELSLAIETARGHGDLSENGDYEAAKEKSGMVEAKIRDLEAKISVAQIIDPSAISNTDKVVFGLSVKLSDLDSGDEKVFGIVGADESDVSRGLISIESPIAKSLIGKQINDIVKVKTPGGLREYEVVDIFIDYTNDALE